MTGIHEQARAGVAQAIFGTPIGMPLTVEQIDALTDSVLGFLAGHEAATRTRVVTTEQVFDALDLTLSDRCDDSSTTRALGRCGCPEDSTLRLAAERVMALYEPEEGRR